MRLRPFQVLLQLDRNKDEMVLSERHSIHVRTTLLIPILSVTCKWRELSSAIRRGVVNIASCCSYTSTARKRPGEQPTLTTQ